MIWIHVGQAVALDGDGGVSMRIQNSRICASKTAKRG